MDTHRHPSERPHPSPAFYLVVGAILIGVTGIEVAAFYLDVRGSVLVPIFIILSLLKFAMVVLFYMHVRYDHRLFGSFFVVGLMLALGVALGFIALFDNFDVGDPNVAAVGPTSTPTPTLMATPTPTPGPGPTETMEPTPTSTPPGPEPTETVEPTPTPSIDGSQVFIGRGCGGCHTIDGLAGAIGQVGPELTHIGTIGAQRKSGLNAEDYIRESIEDPTAFVVDGFPPVMPQLRSTMTDEEFDALVDYLLSHE